MTSSFSEINENLFKFRVKALLFKGNPDIKNNEIVQTKKLDDFEIKPGNNFLKIDTEGHELEVLKGTVGYLEKKIFNYIILEIQKPNTYKNYDPNSIYALLNKYSYHKVKEFNVPFIVASTSGFVVKL